MNKIVFFFLIIPITLVLVSGLLLASQQNASLEEARKLFQQDKYIEAINILNKVLQENSEEANAYVGLGTCYTQLGKMDMAEHFLLKAIEINPGLNSAYRNLGVLKSEQKRYIEANKLFLKALEINNKDELSKFNMAINYIKLDEYQNALKLLLPLLKLRENDAGVLRALYIVYLNQKKYLEMLDVAKKLSNLLPENSISALDKLGMAYFLTNRHKKSIKIYEEINKKNHDSHSDYMISRNYAALLNYDKALFYAEKAIKHSPENEEYIAWKPQLFTYKKDYNTAIRLLNDIPTKELSAETRATMLLLLSSNFSRLGEFKKAIIFYEKLLDYIENESIAERIKKIISNLKVSSPNLHYFQIDRVKPLRQVEPDYCLLACLEILLDYWSINSHNQEYYAKILYTDTPPELCDIWLFCWALKLSPVILNINIDYIKECLKLQIPVICPIATIKKNDTKIIHSGVLTGYDDNRGVFFFIDPEDATYSYMLYEDVIAIKERAFIIIPTREKRQALGKVDGPTADKLMKESIVYALLRLYLKSNTVDICKNILRIGPNDEIVLETLNNIKKISKSDNLEQPGCRITPAEKAPAGDILKPATVN